MSPGIQGALALQRKEEKQTGPELVTTAPAQAVSGTPEQFMLRMLEVVRDRVESIHAGQKAVMADLRDVKANLPMQRRPLSARTMQIHIRATWLRRAGYCPLCELTQVCSEFDRIGDSEFDHVFSRHNNRVTATWLICHGCHSKITNDTTARADAMAAFRVYQQAVKTVLSDRQMLLGMGS